jgi:hypothetical protein
MQRLEYYSGTKLLNLGANEIYGQLNTRVFEIYVKSEQHRHCVKIYSTKMADMNSDIEERKKAKAMSIETCFNRRIKIG